MGNVILISLDTLRADVAYSGKFQTIQQLRNSGITFKNTVASAPLTPISHASVFTGLQPPKHGIRHLFKEKMKKNLPTLASILKNNGYKTGAIVSCPGMNKWYNLNKGFSFYDDEIPRLANGEDPLNSVDVNIRGTALKRAPLVISRAVEFIKKKQDKPFFLFMHFFDAHWPYEAPEKFNCKTTNPYEDEVAYMDHYLGKFFEQLREINYDISQDLVVLFSDHGEDLAGWYPNDHAGKQLNHPEEMGHGCLLYDTTQLVPLIINTPVIRKTNLEIDEQVRLIDITPTMLDLLKIQYPPDSFDGTSLCSLINNDSKSIRNSADRAAYSETFYLDELKEINSKFKHLSPLKSVRINNKLKVIWSVEKDEQEIYHLNDDPNEKDPITLF